MQYNVYAFDATFELLKLSPSSDQMLTMGLNLDPPNPSQLIRVQYLAWKN